MTAGHSIGHFLPISYDFVIPIMAAKTSFLLNDGDNANAAAAINLLADQGWKSKFHMLRNNKEVLILVQVHPSSELIEHFKENLIMPLNIRTSRCLFRVTLGHSTATAVVCPPATLYPR